MHLDERSDEFWQLTNQGGMATSQTFPTRIPVSSPPPYAPSGQGLAAAGDGVIRAGALGEYTSRNLLLKPFGTGPTGATFSMNVYALRATTGSFFGYQGHNAYLLIPTLLASYSITLGNLTGVAGTDLGPQYAFAGTITQTFGPTWINTNSLDAVDCFNYSPGASGAGEICLRTMGARLLEVTFQLGTATGANCLYAKM